LAGTLFLAALTVAGYGIVAAAPGLNMLAEPRGVRDEEEMEARRSDELEVKWQWLVERLSARAKVLKDLADHRLGLLDAAARFRSLDRGPANEMYLRWLRYSFKGDCDEERYCRMVIALVREQGSSPGVVRRLEKELDEYRHRSCGSSAWRAAET
jgi:hypothetical protein